MNIKGFIFLILIFLSSASLSAQVVVFPHIFYPQEFSSDAVFMNDVHSWMSIRHVINQDEIPDFGHDWETGVNISIFSSPWLAVRGMSNETFHFKAAPQPEAEWIFNPQSIISDLRLMIALNIDPVLLSGGFQHDCKHDVDHSVIRQVIHDSLFLLIRPADDITLIRTDLFSFDVNTALEGGVNLPPVFQEAAPHPDIGHGSFFLRLKGYTNTDPGIAVVLDGSASITKRKEETNVEGIEPWGFDFSAEAGFALIGSAGEIIFSLGSERLTDTWVDFDEAPVQIHYITLEFSA